MLIDPRISEISEALKAMHDAWPFLLVEINKQIASLTGSLIALNNDETRGRIKALVSLKDLPQTLLSEREQLTAPLADEAGAYGLLEQSGPQE